MTIEGYAHFLLYLPFSGCGTLWKAESFVTPCSFWKSDHFYEYSPLVEAPAWTVIRLSLPRAPKVPDAHADMKHHHTKWAIMPHQGSLGSGTVRVAYNFNLPMTLVSLLDKKPSKDLFNAITLTGSKSLILDVVKRGEDDEDVSYGKLTQHKGQSVILRI
jgi:alpha-mannosidase